MGKKSHFDVCPVEMFNIMMEVRVQLDQTIAMPIIIRLLIEEEEKGSSLATCS